MILSISLTFGCSQDKSLRTVQTTRYTDLLRIVEDQELELARELSIATWSLDGDTRPVLFQHPPAEVVLGPIPPGQDCVLRFGMGFAPQVLTKSDGVEFRVSLRQAHSEQLLFSEFVDPRVEAKYRWMDRELAIPGDSAEAFSIILATATGATPSWDHSGWSSPHVVCAVARTIPSQSPRPNVVLISIDTLRPDHLGFYGYSRPTSPTLDALAEESIIFENAFTTAPHTLPSHASMLTGLYPHEHRAGHRFPEAPLEEEVTTVAETLRKAGYRTIGFSAGGMASGRYGLSQGFQEWTERQPATFESVIPAVLDAFDRAKAQPVFLFIHTYDVHGPYEQPAAHRFFSPADTGTEISDPDWEVLLKTHAHEYQKFRRFQGFQGITAAYDSGIRYVDSQLARLFEHLREAGAFENTLLIVTSDHGESMFERGRYISHAYTLNDEEMRIPLLVRLPESRDKGRRTELVQLVDLVPMILDEAGVQSATALTGTNPLSRPPEAKREWVHGEASHTGARYLRTLRWKIISASGAAWETRKKVFGSTADRFETDWQIFDLSADPNELENLFGGMNDYPAEVRRFVRTVLAFEVPGQDVDPQTMPEGKDAEVLRALGYL